MQRSMPPPGNKFLQLTDDDGDGADENEQEAGAAQTASADAENTDAAESPWPPCQGWTIRREWWSYYVLYSIFINTCIIYIVLWEDKEGNKIVLPMYGIPCMYIYLATLLLMPAPRIRGTQCQGARQGLPGPLLPDGRAVCSLPLLGLWWQVAPPPGGLRLRRVPALLSRYTPLFISSFINIPYIVI